MKTDFQNLGKLIRLEVNRAVEAVFESSLYHNEEEKDRQKSISRAVDDRKLRASDEKSSVEEAEEEAEEEAKKDEDQKDLEDKEPEKRADRTGGKGTADSSKAADPKISDLKKPSLTNFVDKLNILRGGKSLKDPAVKQAFDNYLGTLNLKEKQTMLVFLTAISQILVGKKSGADAMDPGEVGLRIKSPEVKKPKEKSEPSSPAGTDSVPIVVGESQNDKLKIKKMIESYRAWK